MIRTKFKDREFELQYGDNATFVLYEVFSDGTKMPIIDASCLFCEYTDEGFDGIGLYKKYFKNITEEENRDFKFRFLD